MPCIDDFEGLRGWFEMRMGYDPDRTATGKCAVLPCLMPDAKPLQAFKSGDTGMMRTRPEWVDRIQDVVNELALDELFSAFGAYEPSRITLEKDIGVWGPSWYFFADQNEFRPAPERDVVQLTGEEIESRVDAEIFWHCNWQDAEVGFGIFEQDRLVALTTVRDLDTPVYEIDVDVAPNSGQRGLGRAVMSAAGRWILNQGALMLARTAPWNVPSARLIRSMGMRYVLCDLVSRPGPFRVPPQVLGKPMPETRLHNLYPNWAMNQEILPRA